MKKKDLQKHAAEVEKIAEHRKALKRERELAHTRRSSKAMAQEIDRLEELLRIATGLEDRADNYQPIEVKRRETTAKEGLAVLLVSDLHVEETVTPETVNGLNEFNPRVASKRFDQLIIGTRWLLDTVRATDKEPGYKIRELMLPILGDLISNTIHDDLTASNAMGPADAINLAMDLLQRLIDALLADPLLERLVIPCCMGNHDRLTQDYRHQTKAETSLATILYAFMARLYRNEPRVVFDIARGNMVYTKVYGHTIRCTHGDDVKYNGGVGGITIPLRKAIDSWNQAIPADLTVCGHWHQCIEQRDFVVNGSLIGYTAYSQAIKARFEPAAQAFFVLDASRGKRLFSPVQVSDTDRWS